MTNPNTRSPMDVGGPAPVDGGVPPLVFADAAGAKRWARELPLTNTAAACRAVLGQLRALAAIDIAPRERASIADVLRDQIAYLHTELARRYAGRPHPAEGRAQEASELATALWQELWGQYSACLKPMLDGVAELAAAKAKLLQRGLYVGKQLVLVHGLARRATPPTVWHELHAYYRLAEMLECTVAAVSDHLLPNAVGISCYSTYSHAVLLGLADPCAMSVKQIELTDRWLAMWARKLFPYAQQRESEGPVIIVDLDGSSGARVDATPPREAPVTMRFGYAGKLATSVRGRLKRLQVGATPAELQLGNNCTAEQCTTLLGYLDARWYQAPRQDESGEPAAVELCAGGLPAAFFRIAGREFERREEAGRMTFHGVQRLQVLNVVGKGEVSKQGAEREWPWETWTGNSQARDAALVREGEARYTWQLDQLAVVRRAGEVRAAYATRVALETDHRLTLALRLWPGVPKALTLRPLTATTAGDAPLPGLLLGETPEDKASLVLPPRSFTPSRVLYGGEGSATRRYRLKRLLQRGADFERASFEETSA